DLRPVGQIGGGAGIFEGQILDVLGHDLQVRQGRLALGRARFRIEGAFAAHGRSFLDYCLVAPAGPRPARVAGRFVAPRATTDRRNGASKSAFHAFPWRLGSVTGWADHIFCGFRMPDAQTLGLLAAALVAAIILFRLYTVLGRRTGHEPQPQPQPPVQRGTLAPVAPPAASEPVASSNGLLDIQIADPAFDTPKFLTGAREAYTQIVTAFAAGDRAAL